MIEPQRKKYQTANYKNNEEFFSFRGIKPSDQL